MRSRRSLALLISLVAVSAPLRAHASVRASVHPSVRNEPAHAPARTSSVRSAPSASDYAPDRVIVRFAGASMGRSSMQARLPRGAALGQRFHVVSNLAVVELSGRMSVEEAIEAFSRDPMVLYAEPDYVLTADALPDDAQFGELWGLHNTGQSDGLADADIDAPEAWDLTSGAATVVAVLDTGITPSHPDLAANLFHNTPECVANGIDDDGNGVIDDCYGFDAVEDDPTPIDENGHGTHVAGTIAAVGNNAEGVIGVAHGARVLTCRFLDRFGRGFDSDAIECLEYVKTMKDLGHPIVATNNSWGTTAIEVSHALVDAIEANAASDILFVASAGNTGVEVPSFPGGIYLPNVVSVAATTRTDALAEFSTHGRHVTHIGAPGQSIVSTVPTFAAESGYGPLSGTSMAAPHVAGVAALLEAADPTLTFDEIRNLLLAGGDPIESLDGTTISGRRLNAQNALECSGRVLLRRMRPLQATVVTRVGHAFGLSMLHVSCAAPNGPITLTATPGGEQVSLEDDGLGFDALAGDGIYSATWTPSAEGTFTFAFPDGDDLVVEVTSDVFPNPDSSTGDLFGYRMASGDGLVAIAAPLSDLGGPDAGAVYVYDATTHALLYSIPNPLSADSNGYFGYSLAIGDGIIVAGAPFSDAGAVDSGTAYVFDAATGALVHTLFNPAPSLHSFYGLSVAVVAGNAAVGSLLADTAATDSGAVYLFDAGTGALLHTFTDSEPGDFANFGSLVAAEGETLFVSVPNVTGFDPEYYFGAVRAFNANPSHPAFGQVVRSYVGTRFADVVTTGRFGDAMQVRGNVLVVGDRLALFRESPVSGRDGTHEKGRGVLFVYDVATGERRLLIPNPYVKRGLILFGQALALSDGRILAGDSANDLAGVLGGAVYGFDAFTGNVEDLMLAPSGWPTAQIGYSLAMAGSDVLAGAPADSLLNLADGAAYAFPVRARDDHWKCYGARAGNGQFAPQTVDADDGLVSGPVAVTKPAELCNAAGKNGAPLVRPGEGAVCYRIRDLAAPAFVSRDVDALIGYGQRRVTLLKPKSLCSPAAFGGPAPAGFDHYKCYTARLAKGEQRIVAQTFPLSDAFEDKSTVTKRLSRLCVPVSVGGAALNDPDLHVACYKAGDAKGQVAFGGAEATASDGFGSLDLRARKAREVCMPARLLDLP